MNSISPKITIAIPTYNRLEYLKESVQSILNQTYQNFEIIIFDDQSEYPIEQFLSFFNDQRITFLRNAIKLSNNRENFQRIYSYKFKTEFLVIFHDDDVMRPDFLEKSIQLLKKYNDAIFSASNLNFIKNNKKINNFKYNKNPKITILNNHVEFVKLLLSNFNLCFDSVMYRTKFLENPLPFYQKFHRWNDRPYLVNLAKKGKIIIINDKLINYRIHLQQDSKTSTFSEKKYLFNLLLYYKNNLPTPLNLDDKKIFYTHSTNNLILSSKYFCNNIWDLKKFIKIAIEKKLFIFKYLRIKTLFYIIKSCI